MPRTEGIKLLLNEVFIVGTVLDNGIMDDPNLELTPELCFKLSRQNCPIFLAEDILK